MMVKRTGHAPKTISVAATRALLTARHNTLIQAGVYRHLQISGDPVIDSLAMSLGIRERIALELQTGMRT